MTLIEVEIQGFRIVNCIYIDINIYIWSLFLSFLIGIFVIFKVIDHVSI